VNKKKEKIIKLSDDILNYLLKFKEKNPNFTFSLRKRDSVQSKEKRLHIGQWFQGSHYIYVPLFRKGDNARKIKTIGFVIGIEGDGSLVNYLEISFKSGIDDPKEKEFHTQLANHIDLKLHEKNHGIKTYEDQNDIWNNLNSYITDFRTYALKLLDELDIKNRYVITENDFQKDLNRINAIKVKLHSQIKKNDAKQYELENACKMLNQIFYGPPGTGKTFHTINEAIFLINPQFDFNQDRKIIKKEFERLVMENQIMFTTFHQSMSYEDFIEGIKPLKPDPSDTFVKYDVQNGIFKLICKEATILRSSTNFEDSYSKFIEDIQESVSSIIFETPVQKRKFNIRISTNQSLIVIPQTEKASEMSVTKEMIRDYIFEGKIRDWKSYTVAIGEYLKANYDIKIENVDNSKKNFVLIIDEINRGNVSQIFGELITLIEEDKRLDNSEALEVILPYSKEKFGVPPNLHIIGTMNTADRSLESLDSALRRRFSFIEMMPETELLSPSALYCQLLWKYKMVGWEDPEFVYEENKLFDFIQVSDDLKAKKVAIWETMKINNERDDLSYFNNFEYTGINLQLILETINTRIEVLLNRDYLIGHAYFINVKTEEELLDVFKNKIIPLLQEYFYNDYQKIALILGEGFVTCLEFAKQNNIFAKFSRSLDLPAIEPKFELIEDIDISTAINNLLNLE